MTPMIYVPYSDFSECARVFDDRTLSRQCIYILRLLKHYQKNSRYYTRPSAVEEPTSIAAMWQNNRPALVEYGMILAQERLNRGKNDAMLIWIASFRGGIVRMPKWLGWEPLHRSHRSALVMIGERQCVAHGIHQLLVDGQRLDTWLADGYCESLENLDWWALESLGRRLQLDYNIDLQANYYREHVVFNETPNLPLVWPYQYVEESDERITRRCVRTQRHPYRGASVNCSPETSERDWSVFTPGATEAMGRA